MSSFRQVDFSKLVRFNSLAASKLYSRYETFAKAKVIKKYAEPKSQVFVPSGMRCKRKSWFRLRGVPCDTLENPDMQLEFTAEVGTACHQVLQENLSEMLGADWLSVSDYLSLHPIPYKYTLQANGYETKVSIESPPMHFACDGIMRLDNVIYLLEIKTCDHKVFEDLTDVKQIHKDQANAYATMLQIPRVLFIYESRLTGERKIFEYTVPESIQQTVLDSMTEIQYYAENNLAPEKLITAHSDYMCRNCEYQKRCKEW